MFWNSEKEDRKDRELDQNLSEFVEQMNDPLFAHSTLRIFFVINVFIWFLVLIFPNLIVEAFYLLNEFSNKLSMLMFSLPFGSGLYLAYTIFRIKIPDVEENKSLNSDLMGSMDYQSAANKRYYVWTASILAGFFNAILITIVCITLESKGLYLFSI